MYDDKYVENPHPESYPRYAMKGSWGFEKNSNARVIIPQGVIYLVVSCRHGQKTRWRWWLINSWKRLRCPKMFEKNAYGCVNISMKVSGKHRNGTSYNYAMPDKMQI